MPSNLSQSSSTEAPATPDAAGKSIKVKKIKGPQDGFDSDDDAHLITEATKEKQLDDAFNTLERSMTQSVYFLPDGAVDLELLPLDVKVDDVVGEGAFGEIRCGRWRGSPVAIKTLKSDCMTDAAALKQFNYEITIWCRLVHPNIVQFLGVGCKAKQPPIMVCELMGGGSLQQKLLELQSSGKKMDFDRAFKIASNLAAALNYIFPDIQVIVPRRRIQFRKLVDGVEVPSGRCSFDCLYFCWRLGLPRDVLFLTCRFYSPVKNETKMTR